MNDKKKLRILFKSIRSSIDREYKSNADIKICTQFINSVIFSEAELILIYVSVGSETDTMNIIKYSLSHGKRVAVPLCIGYEMIFYEIKNINELIIGRFGIPTVDGGNNLIVKSFDNAVCVMPGLSFDRSGGRLGYGGGFYDRFLSKNKVKTVAFSYERCICDRIPQDTYDIKVDYLITENYILKTLKQGGFYI